MFFALGAVLQEHSKNRHHSHSYMPSGSIYLYSTQPRELPFQCQKEDSWLPTTRATGIHWDGLERFVTNSGASLGPWQLGGRTDLPRVSSKEPVQCISTEKNPMQGEGVNSNSPISSWGGLLLPKGTRALKKKTPKSSCCLVPTTLPYLPNMSGGTACCTRSGSLSGTSARGGSTPLRPSGRRGRARPIEEKGGADCL